MSLNTDYFFIIFFIETKTNFIVSLKDLQTLHLGLMNTHGYKIPENEIASYVMV